MPGIFKNRTLRIVLVCLACLFAALMLVMQVALNRHVLTRIVNSVAERFVDGDVSFGRVKADVFKSFPNLSVSVDDFTLTYPHGKFAAYDQAGIQSPLREEGRGSRTDTLASLKQLRVSLNYLDALSGRWHVRHAFLTAPRIFLHLYDSTAANWEILRFASKSKEEKEQSPLPTIVVNRISLDGRPHVIFTDVQDTIFTLTSLKDLSFKGKVNTSSLHKSRIHFSMEDMLTAARLPSDSIAVTFDYMKIDERNDAYAIETKSNVLLALFSVGRLDVPIELTATASLPETDGKFEVSFKDMKLKVAPLEIGGSGDYTAYDKGGHLKADLRMDRNRVQDITDYVSTIVPALSKLKTDAELSIEASCDGPVGHGKPPRIIAGARIPGSSVEWKGVLKRGRIALDLGAETDDSSRLNASLNKLDFSLNGAALKAEGEATDILGRGSRLFLDATAHAIADSVVRFIADDGSVKAAGRIDMTLKGSAPFGIFSGNLDGADFDGRIWSEKLGFYDKPDKLNASLTKLDIKLADKPNKADPAIPKGRTVLGVDAFADSLAALLGQSNFIRGRRIRLSGQPLLGNLSVDRLALMGEDSLFVGLLKSRNNFNIGRKEKAGHINFNSGNDGLFFRQGVNRVALKKASVGISASKAASYRQAIMTRLLDSLKHVWPGVPRDSLLIRERQAMMARFGSRPLPSYLSDSTFRAKDLKIDLGEGMKSFFNTWRLSGKVDVDSGRIMTPWFPADNTFESLHGKLNNDDINLSSLTLRSGASDLSATGSLKGLMRMLAGRRSRIGLNLELTSKRLDANELLSTYASGNRFRPSTSDAAMSEDMSDEEYMRKVKLESEQVDTTLDIKAIVLPANLNADIKLRCNEIDWSDLEVNWLAADLLMKERTLQLTNTLATSNMGDIYFEGFYSSKPREDLTAGFDINMVDISGEQVIQLFPAVDTLFPLLKTFQGMLTCEMAATSQLDTDMNLEMPSIKGIIRIGGSNLSLAQQGFLKKVSRLLMFRNRKRDVIDEMSVEGLISDNKLQVFPFVMGIDRYTLAMDGIQNFDQSFKYHLSVLKSPIPFRFGINLRGNDFDNMKWSLTKAKYKNTNVPVFSRQVDTVQINLVNAIHNIFQKGVEKAVQEVAAAKDGVERATKEAGYDPSADAAPLDSTETNALDSLQYAYDNPVDSALTAKMDSIAAARAALKAAADSATGDSSVSSGTNTSGGSKAARRKEAVAARKAARQEKKAMRKEKRQAEAALNEEDEP